MLIQVEWEFTSLCHVKCKIVFTIPRKLHDTIIYELISKYSLVSAKHSYHMTAPLMCLQQLFEKDFCLMPSSCVDQLSN